MTIRQVSTAVVVLVLGSASTAVAQTADFIALEAVQGRIVLGAPYSADGTATVTQTLADGTRIQRAAPSKFFRDSQGNVRLEQTVLGLAALDPSGDGEVVITLIQPTGTTYTLSPSTRTARRTVRVISKGFRIPIQMVRHVDGEVVITSAPSTPDDVGLQMSRPGRSIAFTTPSAPAVKSVMSSLEPRQIEGLTASGSRTVSTLPVGSVGNDRPIEVTSERWVSDELDVVLQSRHHDPRTGTVEFRLTNIQRTEPPRELFTVPQDFRVVDSPPPPPPPPPARPLDPSGPPPPPPPPPR